MVVTDMVVTMLQQIWFVVTNMVVKFQLFLNNMVVTGMVITNMVATDMVVTNMVKTMFKHVWLYTVITNMVVTMLQQI